MLKNLNKYEIILVSKSPRRRNLLKALGLKFSTDAVDLDESIPANMPTEKAALFLAEKKASTYQIKNNQLIITADTIVCLGDEVLGKPAGRKEAQQMLRKLSGNVHDVITGVCIKTSEKQFLFSSTTEVHFKELCEKEISHYIDVYKPYDKAGSYGIQEWIGYIGIDYIKGSFYNVMGLPVQKLYKELLKC
ncbi:MAG: Maf family nucleotide pyrophosphatase [Bacteroidales bacterium]|nr:Maf family nucleotide pyrophosphatase [Bacteroidales bacterium]MCF8343465.1 Maf family nucleotide pyrophosphatase [Bacteroidales bacterium]MCF8352280.1 Maf family nucleotide pyrophosphatase [Bacteroidales bacterium]MCF8375671.1 Maf family nucleotide pyrophosphatase [Bacteroidales bacterium]MCF8401469.1 Maf family nucleotide pyrophosphatase [Bacteroidales bacterium]